MTDAPTNPATLTVLLYATLPEHAAGLPTHLREACADLHALLQDHLEQEAA